MTFVTVSLGDVCDIVSGATPKTETARFWGGDIPWATPRDISNLATPYIEKPSRAITEEGLKNCAARLLPLNSVLLSSRAPIGLVAINTVPMATNQGFKSLIPSPSKLDSKFLFHWLKSKTDFLQSLGNGATFKEISKAVVERIEIPLPPLEEQRRIAAILDKAEALCRKRKRALVLLNGLADSILADFADAQAQSLTVRSLIKYKMIELHKDGNHGSNYPRAEEFDSAGVAFLSAKNILEGGKLDVNNVQRLNKKKASQLKIGWIKSGDVLLSHNASVGKVALYKGELGPALIGTSLTCFRPNAGAISSEYLYMFMRGHKWQNQLAQNMGQTTRNQVPITAQKDLLVEVPPIGIQNAITERYRLIAAMTDRCMEHSRRLGDAFSSLQFRAFSGQL